MSKAAALHAWTEAIRDKAFTKTKARLAGVWVKKVMKRISKDNYQELACL